MALGSTAFAQEAELEQAAQHMREGKPGEAYALLEPLESQHAGELRFDYLFGTAALDAGQADRAVIAFERVLLVDPNFAGARLDLARAYFVMGSDDFAKNELEGILKLEPPEYVRAIVNRYLAAIAERD